jgi:hypothetical protein
VLRYLPTNLLAREIANELYVSTNTVKTHMQHLYAKLGLRRVNSGREAQYWWTHKPMISASPFRSGTSATRVEEAVSGQFRGAPERGHRPGGGQAEGGRIPRGSAAGRRGVLEGQQRHGHARRNAGHYPEQRPPRAGPAGAAC